MTKLDSARGQLETAVELYFRRGNPVAIHTLAAAAYEVLRTVGRSRGSAEMIKDWAPGYVKREYLTEFFRHFNEAQNFFKHADRDPGGVLEFEPEVTDILLVDAVWAYGRLSGERPPILAIFELWAFLTFAAEFVTYDGANDLNEVTRKRLAAMSREQFFAEMWPVAAETIQGHGA